MSGWSISGEDRASSRRAAELDSLLRESIRGSGMESRPLHLTSSPYGPSREAAIAGLLGPPAWSVRLKSIQDRSTQLKATLDAAWAEQARRWRGQPEAFAEHWRAWVAKLDIATLNTLIQKHNDWYPVEARLAIIYPTGEYHIPTGIEYPQRLVTVEAILDEYPADLDMALYFTRQE